MEDVSPGLLEKILNEYIDRNANDTELQAFLKRVAEGTATPQDASMYSRILGDHASEALLSQLTVETLPNGRLYYNIAESTVKPLTRTVWGDSNNVAKKVQNAVNKSEGVTFKAIDSVYPEERVESLVSAASQAGIEFSETQRILGDPFANMCQSFYDDFVMTNAQQVHKSGTDEAKIVRTAEHGACKWCRNLAGSWIYGEQPEDVFRRHDNCRCMVTYKHGFKRQDVWSKAEWTAVSNGKNAIAKKQEEMIAKKVAQETARNTKTAAVERIMKEYHYSSKGASIFYNTHKNEIQNFGLDYALELYMKKG